MVKTKSTSKEIAHLWIHQSQHYAIASNQSFHGNSFYSWQAEIGARRINNNRQQAIFIDNSKYSNYTAQHQSRLIFACNHLTTFIYTDQFVDKSNNYYRRYYQHAPRPSEVTPEFLYNYYVQYANYCAKKAEKARANKLGWLKENKRNLHLANRVIDWFECTHLERVDENNLNSIIDKLEKELAAKLAKEREEYLIKIQKDLDSTKKNLEDWLQGEDVTFPYVWNSKGIFLRVSPKDSKWVVTSRGALFPTDKCETLYKLFKRCQDNDEVYNTEMKLGVYNLNKISKEGIIAGCHHILPEEIERFAEVLNIK